MPLQITPLGKAVIITDGKHRVIFNMRKDHPFSTSNAVVVAVHIADMAESMTVESFTEPLGAGDPDAGLEDVTVTI